ncbi:MAG: hypothetical protein SFX72_03290 [Isosphaeraceae bacterium]|nr:hypothetical protein [Isosphaeraceae bacterium]
MGVSRALVVVVATFAATAPSLPGAAVESPSARLAEIVLPEVEVLVDPEPGAYSTKTLTRGARVRLVDPPRGRIPRGWVAIEPPADAIEWIDERAIRVEPGGRFARVVVPDADLRAGRLGARLPGPVVGRLEHGSEVELRVDVPRLRLGAPGSAGVVRVAVAPAAGSARFVAADAIRPLPVDDPARDSTVARVALDDAPETDGPTNDELVRIDASRRSMLREPLENWEFGPVLGRYRALMESVDDPALRAKIERRIKLVEADARIADSARKLAALIKESRRRDGEVDRVREELHRRRQAALEAYTLVGLIQPSAKEIEGRRLHLLIGDDGATTAYLDIPPGVDLDGLLTRRVGVRGKIGYDDRLGARLIVVRDIEAIGRRRD